jgi:hypothetical protein
VNISALARRHGIKPSLLFRWRRLARDARSSRNRQRLKIKAASFCRVLSLVILPAGLLEGTGGMAPKAQMTGMLGVYQTAVELTRLGLIVSPTSRSAIGADLLVTDPGCQKVWSVQVKANALRAGFWLVGLKAREISSPSHVYVLVNAAASRLPEFYVVPSEALMVDTKIRTSATGSVWFEYYKNEAYRDKWSLFEYPVLPSLDIQEGE